MGIRDIFRSKPEHKPRRPYGSRKPQTLEQALEQALIRQAKKDHEWALNKALKKFNLEDDIEKPGQREKEEIAHLIAKRALDEIKNDPNLTKDFVAGQVRQIIGEPEGGYFSEGGTGFDGSPTEYLLRELNNMNELKAALGINSGGGGILGGLINADVVREAIAFLRETRGGQPTNGQPQERTVVIQVDGEPREVSESDYNRLLRQGKIKPIAALIGESEPELGDSREDRLEEGPVEPQLPELLDAVDIDEVGGYLEYSPEEFVALLNEQSNMGMSQAKFLIDYLIGEDVNSILQTILPYRENSKVKPYIDKLVTDEGREWLSQVLQLVADAQSTQNVEDEPMS